MITYKTPHWKVKKTTTIILEVYNNDSLVGWIKKWDFHNYYFVNRGQRHNSDFYENIDDVKKLIERKYK
jgi:hypothetical protein